MRNVNKLPINKPINKRSPLNKTDPKLIKQMLDALDNPVRLEKLSRLASKP